MSRDSLVEWSESAQPLVAIIDDEESIRGSLVRLVESAHYQVEAFASAAEFLEWHTVDRVSCVVSDLYMPVVDGLQLQQLLKSKAPFISIVFVTEGGIPSSVQAMKAGAVDVLEKPIRRNPLLDAITAAVDRTNEARRAAAETVKLKRRYCQLTSREREVFALVSLGLPNRQVAAQLGAAEKTVKQHRGCIMGKMGADSFAQLVVMADRLGVRPINANLEVARGKLSRELRL